LSSPVTFNWGRLQRTLTRAKIKIIENLKWAKPCDANVIEWLPISISDLDAFVSVNQPLSILDHRERFKIQLPQFYDEVER